MALPVEFELIIPLAIGMFFSFLFEADTREMLWSGVVAMVCWIVTGLVFLITSVYPVIALVFSAVGIIYIIRILLILFEPLKSKRKFDDEAG